MTPPTPINDSGRADLSPSAAIHALGPAARGPRPTMAGREGEGGRGAGGGDHET